MKLMKRMFVLLLAGLMLLSAVSCGQTQTNTAASGATALEGKYANMTDEEYFEKEFKPILRFVVASDVHIHDTGSDLEEERLPKLFDVAYDYAKKQKGYKELDAVLIAGDFVDRGTPNSMKKAFALANESVKGDTVFHAIMGNHEFYHEEKSTPATEKNWLAASGYDSPDAHLIIGGYHFIMVSPDSGGKGYSNKKQNWLADELKKAAADDPTGRKPIFVLQHHHISDTVYGSGAWGVEDLRKTLNNYPQVIDFSGHSHFPISDPTSMWQDEFTALGTGTLSYYEMGLAGVDPDYIFPIDDEGSWAEKKSGERDAAQFYIVEVDANNAIKIQGYDLLSDTFMIEPYLLRTVGDPAEFKYTNARAEASEVPVFPEDAAIEIVNLTAFGAKLRFPQASCKDNVQHYRCELYLNGELKDTVYSLSCTFFRPTPETISAIFSKVYAGKEYTVKIYAVNSWAKDSEPLVGSFTVPNY